MKKWLAMFLAAFMVAGTLNLNVILAYGDDRMCLGGVHQYTYTACNNGRHIVLCKCGATDELRPCDYNASGKCKYCGASKSTASSNTTSSNTTGSVAKQCTITYVLKYTLNNGTTAEVGKKISLPSPSRPGYTFEGWYKAPEGGDGTYVGAAGADYTPTGNVSLYAMWKENSTQTTTITEGSTTTGNTATTGNAVTMGSSTNKGSTTTNSTAVKWVSYYPSGSPSDGTQYHKIEYSKNKNGVCVGTCKGDYKEDKVTIVNSKGCGKTYTGHCDSNDDMKCDVCGTHVCSYNYSYEYVYVDELRHKEILSCRAENDCSNRDTRISQADMLWHSNESYNRGYSVPRTRTSDDNYETCLYCKKPYAPWNYLGISTGEKAEDFDIGSITLYIPSKNDNLCNCVLDAADYSLWSELKDIYVDGTYHDVYLVCKKCGKYKSGEARYREEHIFIKNPTYAYNACSCGATVSIEDQIARIKGTLTSVDTSGVELKGKTAKSPVITTYYDNDGNVIGTKSLGGEPTINTTLTRLSNDLSTQGTYKDSEKIEITKTVKKGSGTLTHKFVYLPNSCTPVCTVKHITGLDGTTKKDIISGMGINFDSSYAELQKNNESWKAASGVTENYLYTGDEQEYYVILDNGAKCYIGVCDKNYPNGYTYNCAGDATAGHYGTRTMDKATYGYYCSRCGERWDYVPSVKVGDATQPATFATSGNSLFDILGGAVLKTMINNLSLRDPGTDWASLLGGSN